MFRQALALVAVLVFTTLEARADAPERSEVGGEILYGQVDSGMDETLIGILLQGHFLVTPGLTLGGRMPIAHSRTDTQDGTALGNLTFDLAYHLSYHRQGKSWLEANLYLPTASDSGDGRDTATLFSNYWVPEMGLYLPDATTTRVMYNFQLGPNEQHLHFAAGAEYQFITDGVDDRVVVPFVIGGRVALGDRAAALGRFRTHWNLDAPDGADDFFHTLQFGLELSRLGRGALTALFYLPLDDAIDGWGLTFAYAVPL
jgi:hypothetical protein